MLATIARAEALKKKEEVKKLRMLKNSPEAIKRKGTIKLLLLVLNFTPAR